MAAADGRRRNGDADMKLERLTERIYYYPFEEERDRPNLGYIRGDRWSLAVDAGHSAAHTKEFYQAIQSAGLPLPALTVITHWHWDHALGMHAVNGLTLSGKRTNGHLKALRDQITREGPNALLSLHESIRREYANGQTPIVTLADMTFEGEMELDLGNFPIRLLQTAAPHTDDSTLIFAPDEKALFVGDAACGSFPDWEKDASLCRALADTVESTRADIVLESHWTPAQRREFLQDLLSGE